MLKTTAFVSAALLLCSCGVITPISSDKTVSRLDTVDIPQTAVRDQQAAGYCWAYATIGLIESKAKAEKGLSLNLSEEAVAFWRVIEELSYLGKSYANDSKVTFNELATEVNGNEFQGWVFRTADFPLRDGFQLVDDFGVVPESVWNVKFDSPAKTAKVINSVRSGFLRLVKSKERTTPVTQQELEKVVGDAFGSVPPKEFMIDGQLISAVDYSHKVLGFEGSSFAAVESKGERDVNKVVQAAKLAMARGLAVPIGFGVTFSMLNGGTFSAPNVPEGTYDGLSVEKQQARFASDGGHAVLVTDFVNVGGVEGLVPSEQLNIEVQRAVGELSYLKVKNSWGFKASKNEAGKVVRGSADGYYRLDLGYLKGEASAEFLMVAVPADIAALVEQR